MLVKKLWLLLSGLFARHSQWLDGIAKSLGYEGEHHYAVVIDCGSTGSRVLAFKFRVPFSVLGQRNLDIEEEFFFPTTPGLSAYAANPEEGADTIAELIKKAKFFIPPEKRPVTPILVRATAGLRLLTEEESQGLLESTYTAISTLGFDVNENSVAIMDGSDEGIFGWYTVNLLNNLIGGDTMDVLDLGGASTQITYELSEADKPHFPPKDQFVVPAGNNITLYAHSYLNLGGLAARLGIFGLESGNPNTRHFKSVCLDPSVKKQPWSYAGTQYFVSGKAWSTRRRRSSIMNSCHAIVKRYVMRTRDWEPKQPPKGAVGCMSFFYDVAVKFGLIDDGEGGTVSVAKYRAAAQRACSKADADRPWGCMDLLYVVTLLHDLYKIPDEDPVALYNTIRGHQVSWALGLAYSTVMNRLSGAK